MPMEKDNLKGPNDPDLRRVAENVDAIEDKLPKLKRAFDQAKVMLAMVKDYLAGHYREVPYWAISAAAIALLYVLNPVDVIPDIIPGFGYLDDAAVVAFCLRLMEREIEKYQEWKSQKKPRPTNDDGPVIDV